ncbi:DUF4259 domain-containing protein [Rhodococcus sp. OK302]|uniref:DUF4259 domain-containing protein n=1 Tax=Rhodococcus sp. OK302 TaxID=1882769 RepID=UPI000B93F0BC|nr:DUF4259 domain-containing protein [Rhodococcus sp. OK302]OYD60879.1 hypothetical protein BDB13_5775 [Rhodococcus sp. OK302]
MGVWGSGNFDSDTVADGLGMLTGRIVDDITAEFEDDSSLEPDEWGGEMVPAWLEILTEIAETRRVGVSFPSTTVLIDWRDRYLRVWDGYIDELEPDDDYKVERRAVLVRTFERAVAVAAERERV